MVAKARIGLIGSGFMGKTHALGFRAVGAVFEMPIEPALEVLADIDAETAMSAAARLGFGRFTDDWRKLVQDPAVDVVDITTPPMLHHEMAMAAIAAGKHTYCEKPLAPSAALAKEMAEAAERAGVKTQVGFNYLKNPMLALARDIIARGELGAVVSFRGIHAEDYMADAATPWHWRLDPRGGGGVVADLGSHIIAIARYLLGPISAVCGQLETVVKQRPVRMGAREMRPVEVDDVARALVRFARGCNATIET